MQPGTLDAITEQQPTLMLQVITGKFFKNVDRHKTPRRAVLFSNYDWIDPIETCIGTLEPVYAGGIATWVFSYVNQMERDGGKFSIVRIGDDEIVEQFRLLSVFGLRAYFASQRHEVEHYCRQTRMSVTDDSIPSQMLSRYFAMGLRARPEEPKEFAKFVEKCLSLKRDRYLATVAALRTFCSALEATSTSVDLAYSMLIYALESLAQAFDSYQPVWSDYEDKVRTKIDGLLSEVGGDVPDGVRAALLESAHLKLTKRFLCFVESHTDDSYFTVEAEGVQGAIRKAEFARALKHAYRMRSGYVHELKPIVSQLRVPSISQRDAFRCVREPYLTLSGLVRLTSHVLKNFIDRGESVTTEEVNWRDQLPGVVKMRMSPEYWIHDGSSFSGHNASDRYSAFLEHFLARMQASEPIVEMTAVMEKIEAAVCSANKAQKIAMLCLYWVYNCSLSTELRRPNWEQLLNESEPLLDNCCMETASARLALGADLDWSLELCSQCFDEYNHARFGRTITQIPHMLEIALLVTIANKALAAGKADMHKSYLERAILNSPGLTEIQKFLGDALEREEIVDCNRLLFGKPTVLANSTPEAPQAPKS